MALPCSLRRRLSAAEKLTKAEHMRLLEIESALHNAPYNGQPAFVRRLGSAAPADGSVAVGAEIVEDQALVEARQRRSRHISEQLQKLQQESRQLQEQSRLLTERAIEMQRNAGIPVAANPAPPVPAPPALASTAIEQGQEQQQPDASAHEAEQQQAQLQQQPEAPNPASVAIAATTKGAPISWGLPSRMQSVSKGPAKKKPPTRDNNPPPLPAGTSAAPNSVMHQHYRMRTTSAGSEVRGHRFISLIS